MPLTLTVVLPRADAAGEHPPISTRKESGTAGDWRAVVLSAVLLVALGLAFALRGVVQSGLARRVRPEAALLLTATLLACVHPPRTITPLVPFAVGVGSSTTKRRVTSPRW